MCLRISEHLCFVSLCVYLKKTLKKNICVNGSICVCVYKRPRATPLLFLLITPFGPTDIFSFET